MNKDCSSVFQRRKRLEKTIESKRNSLENHRKLIDPRKDECISVLEARKYKKVAEMKNCYWMQIWAKNNISSEILQLEARIDELKLLKHREEELEDLEQQLFDILSQGWGNYPGVLDENVVVEYRDKFRTLSVQMTPEVPFINIVMIGETGSGKSSLLRTFTTALTNKTTIKDIYRTSPKQSTEISVTKQIHLEKMYIGDEKLQLPCKFYDVPGIAGKDTFTEEELIDIIDGKMKLDVDPQASSLANEVHCVLYVVNATSNTKYLQNSNGKGIKNQERNNQKDAKNDLPKMSVAQKSFEVITKIIKEKNHEDGVRQFVVVTNIDRLGVPNDDMKNAYKYPCIREFCEKVSEAYGVDLLHVIPLSNYFEEVASNDAKNAMSLYNLWRVFESGKEYIERKLEDKERFFGKGVISKKK